MAVARVMVVGVEDLEEVLVMVTREEEEEMVDMVEDMTTTTMDATLAVRY